jgi:hypothetical protein
MRTELHPSTFRYKTTHFGLDAHPQNLHAHFLTASGPHYSVRLSLTTLAKGTAPLYYPSFLLYVYFVQANNLYLYYYFCVIPNTRSCA